MKYIPAILETLLLTTSAHGQCANGQCQLPAASAAVFEGPGLTRAGRLITRRPLQRSVRVVQQRPVRRVLRALVGCR